MAKPSRSASDIPAHWPRPNVARTLCLECGRPIAKAGNGWLHAPPGRGRKRTTLTNFTLPAIRAWHQANDDVIAAKQARDDAFVAMCEAGMIAKQVADATGMPHATVAWLADQLEIKFRQTDIKRPRTILKQRAGHGSVIWGDDDIMRRPEKREKA